MRHNFGAAFVLLATLSLFPTVVAGQHPEHQSSPATPKAEAEARKQAGMMAHHQEIQTLVDQLLQSLTALEQEKDPEALKSRLSEHRALLEQLQKRIKQCSEMMEKGDEQKHRCPMMGAKHKHH